MNSSLAIHPDFRALIPPRAEVEERYLRGSLLSYGCQTPLQAWNGYLLDGHRRETICVEHRLQRDVTEVPLPSEAAAAVWVGLAHVTRHDLNDDRRAAACANVIRRLGETQRDLVEAASDGRVTRGLTKSKLGDLAEVSARRIADALEVAVTDATLFDAVFAGSESLLGAKRQLRDRKVAKQRDEMAQRVQRLTRDVRHGDFRRRLDDLPDDSVDLIFTDPPYHKKHLALFYDLATLAGRVLRPGGSLICYAGVHGLPRILPAMEEASPDLRFWWQLCLRHSASFSRQHGWRVHVHYKPMLWFVKGIYRGPYMVDVIESKWLGKNWHGWEQSEAEAAHCIERLSPDNGLVLDPMCGSGTTLVTAKRLGRRWLGVDVDRQAAKISQARLRSINIPFNNANH